MTWSIDLAQLLACAAALLLMIGAIPFTPASVGVCLLLSMCRLTFKVRP